MWVDGMNITKDNEVKHVYTIDKRYIFLTDEIGKIMLGFDACKMQIVENEFKDVAQKYIFRYDVIKKIQDEIS